MVTEEAGTRHAARSLAPTRVVLPRRDAVSIISRPSFVQVAASKREIGISPIDSLIRHQTDHRALRRSGYLTTLHKQVLLLFIFPLAFSDQNSSLL